VVLTWIAPANIGGSAIINYKLYRSTASGGTYALVASPSGLTYTDTGLINGQTYWYKVSAMNGFGEGTNCSAQGAMPCTMPNAPTGLTATPSSDRVVLTWQAPTSTGGSPITGYRLYRGTVSGSLTFLTTVTSTSYTDSSITSGQTYFYKVSAVNSVGEGSLSAEANGKAEDEDHNPPPGVLLDQWPLLIVICMVALVIALIGALVVRNAKKKAAGTAQGYMYCSNCGSPVPPQATNCPKCSAYIRGPR
jgi:ribosomal protein L40E